MNFEKINLRKSMYRKDERASEEKKEPDDFIIQRKHIHWKDGKLEGWKAFINGSIPIGTLE
jgi:hypothetical protein